jgi:hypothetical protein
VARVVMGHDTATRGQVSLGHDDRPLGVTVIGRTGFGKSTLLEHMIVSDINDGISCVVIDAHGDLTGDVIAFLIDPDIPKTERIHLIELWEEKPFRLNLFAVPDPEKRGAVDRTADGIVQVFKKLFGSPHAYAPRLERDLGQAARTVIANNGTLMDVTRLYWDTAFRRQYLQNVTNNKTREYWENFDRIGRVEKQQEQLESTINRLDQFLASELAQQIFGSTETTIPLEKVLNEPGHALFVRIPHGEIGEKMCNYLGSLILCVLANLIYARANVPEEQRNRVHLYLDEYGRFCNPVTASLLTEGRKYNLGTTIAHQTRAQVPDEENRAAELQVGTLVCLRLIPEDGNELAGNFPVKPEPQWEERVEEYEGTEPVMLPTRRPVEHLLRHTVSPKVDKAVNALFVALDRERDENKSKSYSYGDHTFVEEVEQAFQFFNDFLVDCMDGSFTPVSDASIQRVSDFFFEHRRLWRCEFQGFSWQYDEHKERKGRKLIRNVIAYSAVSEETGFIGGDTPMESFIAWNALRRVRLLFAESDEEFLGTDEAFMETFGRWLGEDRYAAACRRLSWEEEIENRKYILPYSPFVGTYEEYLAKREVWSTKTNRERTEEDIGTALKRLRTYASALFTLGEELQAEPILINSGQVRPAKRVRYIVHPQRTYQDVLNERAQELANLPRFAALVRTPEGMHHTNLLGPLPVIEWRSEMVDRPGTWPICAFFDSALDLIREESMDRYGRPWDDGSAGMPAVPVQPIRPDDGAASRALQEPAQPLLPPLKPTRSRKPPRGHDGPAAAPDGD